MEGDSDRFEPRFDQCFKAIMSDIRILSHVIGVLVPDLKDVQPEDIQRMWDDGDIVSMGTELVTPGGKGMSTDLLFRIRLKDGSMC